MKIIVISVVFLIFFSCSRNNSNKEQYNIYPNPSIVETEIIETIGFSEIFPKTMLVKAESGLRIRSEPSLEGEILGILLYGERITVDKISVSAEIIDGITNYWYSIENRNGWVFGGFLSELPQCDIGTSFSFTARGISEGIVLYFHNIPDNANSLSVFLTNIDNGIIYQVHFERKIWENDHLNDLAELRQSKTLVCPFAIKGQEYIVTVFIMDFEILLAKYSVNVVAEGGIFIENNPSLYFINNNHYLKLSERPIFSEENEIIQGLFGFNVKVTLEDVNFGSVGVNRSELISPIHGLIELLQRPFGNLGSIPVIGSVEIVVTHGNAVWSIGIAVTEEALIVF